MELRKAGKSVKSLYFYPANLDLAIVDEVEFNDIDAYDRNSQFAYANQDLNAERPKHEVAKQKATISEDAGLDWEPEKLRNGKWACNHKCKDKTG